MRRPICASHYGSSVAGREWPIFVAVIFALSVGLAGSLWAVVDAIELRPLPCADGHELVAVLANHPRARADVGDTRKLLGLERPAADGLRRVAGLGGLEAPCGPRVTRPHSWHEGH